MSSNQMATLVWHGDLPTDRNMDELELFVIKDLQSSIWGLERPSELIFHTVLLDKSMSGEVVSVWGQEGDDDHFHCEFIAQGEWVSVGEAEDDDVF